MGKKKIYRTVIQIEILSDEPFTEGQNLNDIEYEITEGHCSGNIETKVSNEILEGKPAADSVRAQGSDPEFFRMDIEGNELEDDEEGQDRESYSDDQDRENYSVE